MKKVDPLICAVQQKHIPPEPLRYILQENCAALKELQSVCQDLVIHSFRLFNRYDAVLIFVEGMIDTNQCGLFVLEPLTEEMEESPENIEKHLHVGQTQTCTTIDMLISMVFNGHAAILADNCNTATLIELRSPVGRSISEPDMNRSVFGPRESFVEKVTLNTLLLRRKIHDSKLCMENFFVGRRGQAKLVLAYMGDITDPTIVAEVKQKIQKIDVDAIGSIGQLTQYLQAQRSTPFAQIMPVERADLAAQALLEGRVVVFLDQNAQALVLPVVFWDFFRAADDVSEKPFTATIMRYLRLLCFFASVLLPAWYVALMTWHPQLLPLKLALPLVQYTASIPLSITAEVLFIEILLAILSEAALRTPKQISQAIGLVGGVILGQALISSNLATPPTLVIATASIVAQFAMPHYSIVRTMAILRVAGIIAAAMYGLFGVSLLWFVLLCVLAKMKTFDIPYLAPLGTYRWQDLKSLLFLRRAPQHKKRATYIPVQDNTRQV